MSPTAVRHPVRMATRACELREAGWSSGQIAGILEREFGARPTRGTVLRWCDPRFAERVEQWRRASNMNANAKRWTFRVGGSNPSREYREAFVRRLDAEGVSIPDISRVYGVVFGERFSKDQVAWLLRKDAA